MLEKIGLPPKPALRGNNWVVDASHCQLCSSQFTFINRKGITAAGVEVCFAAAVPSKECCYVDKVIHQYVSVNPVKNLKRQHVLKCDMDTRTELEEPRGSKLSSRHEDELLNEILGSDRKELAFSGELSTSNVISKLERDTSSSSCSNIQDVATNDDEGEERPKSLSVGESSPEELRQHALEEKNKYKILKAEGKSEEALKAFKRGKELERQAGALELLLRKNRKRALSTSNTTDIHKISDENTCSGRKDNLAPQKSKEKDNLADELKELGWSDMDLHAADKKPSNMSLEGELSTLLREVSQKSNTGKVSHGIDKTQVIAHKKKALALKRDGKLAEAKEELKRAKVLEKQLEEEEFLAEAEDSDDELSALIRSIDSDKQDDLLVAHEPNAGFNFDHLMGITDDLGVDSNFEVTDNDMDDPEIAAALTSLGWTEEANHFEDIQPKLVPMDREALSNEIQSLKREALNQKRAGNSAEAMELLKKARVLEKDLDSFVTQGTDTMPYKADDRNVNEMDKVALKLAPKSRLMIQKELLGLKKRALALRREGKLDEADEELRKGKVLEQQLEEMDSASNMKATPVIGSKKNPDDVAVPDLGDEGEAEDVTDQDLHDPTYLSLLSNLGWKDEDDKTDIFPPKPAKQNGSPMQIIDSPVTQSASSILIGVSRRSKGEIQRELLGLKRKALTLRRQGQTEEADEVLEMAKVLEAQLAEMEMPKIEAQSEINKRVENESISSLHKIAVEEDARGVSKEDPQEKSSEQITSISVHPDRLVTEDLGRNVKITHEKREEMVVQNKKPHIDESDSVGATASQNDQSSVRQEILVLKRKAVALKREGKLAEAREELRQAKLLEKSLEDNNSHPSTSSSDVSSSTSNVTSVEQKQHHSSSNLASKPLSSRDRFKLQQESLSHKRLAMKLRREGRMEEAEAEFELAKALEAQLEESGANDSVKSSVGGAKPVDDVGVEDFLDPQLLSALKAIGLEDASTTSQSPEKPEPVKSVSVSGKVENSGRERIQLEEQIKAEKVKAVHLKRSGKQAEALDALRRAKVLEKKLNSLAS
ncbi:unnamed protein product [Camellia sinensis]